MSKKLGETRETPEQLTSDMDKSKPILVIDHQPGELQELAKQEWMWTFPGIPITDRFFREIF